MSAPFGTSGNSLQLAEGFQPESLPVAVPGVPVVRPPSWLVDPQTPEQELAEYLGQFVAGTGTVDPSDLELAAEPRTQAEVVAGFLSQRVRLSFPGAPAVHCELSAGPESVGSYPFGGPVALVGTTAPVGQAVAGRVLHEELADLLAGRGIQLMPAMAVAENHEWVDPAVLADYRDPAVVNLAAVTHMQPFLTLWRAAANGAGVLEVIDLADPLTAPVIASAPAVLRQLAARPCPMIPGAGCGQLCKLHGGPWISRSITAAMRWEVRRDRMIRALGCDTCGDGAVRIAFNRAWPAGRWAVPGRPDTVLPTRYQRVVPAPSAL